MVLQIDDNTYVLKGSTDDGTLNLDGSADSVTDKVDSNQISISCNSKFVFYRVRIPTSS